MQLVSLQVDSNRITHLPQSLLKLADSLTTLNLENNPLVVPPADVRHDTRRPTATARSPVAGS